MKKALLVLFLGLASIVQSQTTYTIGTGTGSNAYFPLYTYYGYTYSQQIYLASELTTAGATAGTISKIRFYMSSTGSTSTSDDNWVVYIGNTAQSSFSSTSNWISVSSMSTVYTGSVTFPSSGNWMEITLSTPFFWNGTSNLVVAVDQNEPNYDYPYSYFGHTSASTMRSIQYYSDGTNPDPSNPPTGNVSAYGFANCQFVITAAAACSGTPASANAVTSASPVCPNNPFSLSLSTSYNFTGMTYQWQSSANNSTWTNISGATGAVYNATQTVATYYRCIITCTNSSASTTSASVYVTMNTFLSCYCTPSSQYGCSSGYYGAITNVTFNQINNNSSWAASSPYFTLYPTTTATTVVFIDNTYNLNVTSYYYNATAAWIDWNQDGTFSTTEYYNLGSNSAGQTWTGTSSITVPASAVPGMTRMRVRTNYYYYGLTSADACTQTVYGETEDYFITVVPTPANDAGIAEVILPSVPTCDLDSVDITVSLNNFGQNALTSCDVKWQINSGSVNTYTFSGSIAGSGVGLDTVVIGNASFSVNDQLNVWTENPNGATDSIAFNDEDSVVTIPGLSGTYSIPNDYATLTAAAADLASLGVCGHVVFELASGTYTEQVTFNNTPGVGPDATVTFTSATGNYSDVIIQHASSSQTNNHVVLLNGADWYIFDELTMKNIGTSIYGNIVNMQNGAHNNTIQNCWLKSVNAGTTGAGNFQSAVYINGNNNNTKILNNRIEKGNTPIYAYGGGTGANSIQGLTVEGNMIEDMQYYGPYFFYISDLEYNGNTVTSDSTAIYGYVYMGNYIYNIERFNIMNNFFVFDVTPNYYNIYMYNCIGSSNPKSMFSNNCVIQGGASSTSYNYYNVYMGQSGNMDIYNNTFNRKGQQGTYYNLQMSGGGNTSIMNNSFSDMSGGYAMYVSGTWTVSGSNYNNFYSTGTNQIYYGVTAYSSLAAYQAGSGYDANSVRTNPAFQNITECITCNDTLNNAATPLSSVQTDVAGNTRSTTTPDIGASEYVTPATFTLGPDDTICGNTAIVEAGPAQSITWNVNSQVFSTPSITLTANNQPITYNVQVNITTEYCGSASDAAVIRLVPNANLDSSANICADGDITLTPGGGSAATYSWSTGDNTATILVNSPGIYTVTKMEEGCESSASIAVTQSDAVVIADVDVCIDDLPVTLDATINDGTSYAWSGGTSVNTAVNTFNDGGTYSVTATDALGCTSTDDFNLTVLETPSASIAENHWGTNYQFDASGSLFISANTTYFWDFGNGQTANTQVANVIYPWNGPCDSAYTVTLTVNNGCGEDISNMTVTPCLLGVNEVVDGAFSVYPNPATESATISFANTFSNGMITLMDISGRTVSSQVVAGGNTSINIDLTNIASGSYIVKLDADGTSSFQQIIVE